MLKRLTYITYNIYFIIYFKFLGANICYSEIIRLYFPFHDIKWCQIGQPLFSRLRIGVDRRKSPTTLYQTPRQNRPTLLDNVCERCWSFSNTSCPFENASFQCQMSVEIENPIFQLLNGGIYTKTSYAKLLSLMPV